MATEQAPPQPPDQPAQAPERAPGGSPAASELSSALLAHTAGASVRHRLRWTHAVLALNAVILIGGAVFAYRVLTAGPDAPPAPAPVPAESKPPGAAPAQPPKAPEPEAPKPQAPEPIAPAAESAPLGGFSWGLSEAAYAARRHGEALVGYRGLLKESEKSEANRRVSDFLRLRAGLCLMELNRPHEARPTLLAVAESTSPAVRSVACHALASMDCAEGQAMMARMRAYQALATLGETGGPTAFETEGEFLAAQAITAKAVASLNGNLPAPRRPASEADLLSGLTEAQLLAVLDESAARLTSAVLGPQVRRKAAARGTRTWTVVSNGAPLDELLARLSAESGLDVRWENVADAARRRTIVMDLSGASDQRLIEVACGAVGLIARFTGSEAVVSDPSSQASAAGARDLLAREAVSQWRRFFLRSSDDGRLAYGHFALATLHEWAGEGNSAMAEYGVVFRRHPTHYLAASARLQTAKIRLGLRDFTGAREELLELLNNCPDCPATDEVYLRLGQAAMEAGRFDEAIATFKKLYFLDLSLASKAGATVGAATCFFRKGQYEDAAGWLGRRIELPRSPAADGNLADAYGLLAATEAARGRLPHAIQAYKDALAASPKSGLRVELLLELAQILAQQEELVAALGVLEGLRPKDITPRQADELLLAKADVLRSMRLPERALSLLKAHLPTVSSPEMSVRLTMALARCQADGGDLEGARRTLGDLLPKMESGPLAHQAALDLAEVCLRGGQNVQAATVCRELLRTSCPEAVRRSAQSLLGRAYLRENDYERAVMALSGLAPQGQGAPKP